MLTDPRLHFRRFELMEKGPRYTFVNLIHMEYTADVVEHLVRYHWGTLVSNKDKDPNQDLEAIYCDLSQAIEHLQGQEREAIRLMVLGYEIRDADNGIAPALGVGPDIAAKICKRAYLRMSDFLQGRNRND
jgi:hypothetical protein